VEDILRLNQAAPVFLELAGSRSAANLNRIV